MLWAVVVFLAIKMTVSDGEVSLETDDFSDCQKYQDALGEFSCCADGYAKDLSSPPSRHLHFLAKKESGEKVANLIIDVPKNEKHRSKVIESYRLLKEFEGPGILKIHSQQVMEKFILTVADTYQPSGFMEFAKLSNLKLGDRARLIKALISVYQALSRLHLRGYVVSNISPKTVKFTLSGDQAVIFDLSEAKSRLDRYSPPAFGYMTDPRFYMKNNSMRRYDQAVDIYSMGVLIYMIFSKTGAPFQGADEIAVENSVKEGQIELPKSAESYFLYIIEKSLKLNPGERISAHKAIEILQLALKDQKPRYLEETEGPVYISIYEETEIPLIVEIDKNWETAYGFLDAKQSIITERAKSKKAGKTFLKWIVHTFWLPLFIVVLCVLVMIGIFLVTKKGSPQVVVRQTKIDHMSKTLSQQRSPASFGKDTESKDHSIEINNDEPVLKELHDNQALKKELNEVLDAIKNEDHS